MNSLPYHKRYHRDFLEGTAGMPFELKGAYSVLLDVIYLHEGAPDDPKYISGQLGCSVRKWNAIRAELIALGKISVDLGIISTSRADKELLILRSYRDQKAENARGSNENSTLPKAPAATDIKPEPESDIEKRYISPPYPQNDLEEAFEQAFEAWPRQEAKGRAKAAWYEACQIADPDLISQAVMEQAPALAKREPKFRPFMATWLRDEGWTNVPAKPPPSVADLAFGPAEEDFSNVTRFPK